MYDIDMPLYKLYAYFYKISYHKIKYYVVIV